MTRKTITGRDETPADTRHRALRESGYRGPVDQDGYENHDHDHVFAEMDRQGRIHGVPGYGPRRPTD
jgi:hypothetical protein